MHEIFDAEIYIPYLSNTAAFFSRKGSPSCCKYLYFLSKQIRRIGLSLIDIDDNILSNLL